MTPTETTDDRIVVNTGLLTTAGVVALIGALLLGIAALMGANALFAAVQQWIQQQEVPPSEAAKSAIRQLHDAALAGTSAATDAWRASLAPTPQD